MDHTVNCVGGAAANRSTVNRHDVWLRRAWQICQLKIQHVSFPAKSNATIHSVWSKTICRTSHCGWEIVSVHTHFHTSGEIIISPESCFQNQCEKLNRLCRLLNIKKSSILLRTLTQFLNQWRLGEGQEVKQKLHQLQRYSGLWAVFEPVLCTHQRGTLTYPADRIDIKSWGSWMAELFKHQSYRQDITNLCLEVQSYIHITRLKWNKSNFLL